MKSLKKTSLGRRNFIKKTFLGFTFLTTGFNKLFALSNKTKKFFKDYRPRFHFVIPDGDRGPFDPSGNLFWKGRHHLFYIFTIYDDRFPRNVANIHGHASSTDLINWTYHPWALVPEPEGPDSAGRCWSGDGFLWEGRPSIAYISNDGQTCLATSEDEMLENWIKHPSNPIIPGQPVENQI